ncbi:MAG: GNAT family N-acetyltransferase, partial [Bdellovibrionota bacterium]
MGIERSHRGGGWGTKLMEVAIGWAKEQPSLDWVQLYVFDHNEPAKALYRKFGFEAVGTVEDLFRVHGQRIADTHMVLNIRK